MSSVSLLLLAAFLLQSSEGAVRGISSKPLVEDLEGHEDIIDHRNLQVPKEKVSLTESLTYQRGGAAGKSMRSMTSSSKGSMGRSSSNDDCNSCPMCFVVSNSEMILMENDDFLDSTSVRAVCPTDQLDYLPISVSCELTSLNSPLPGFALTSRYIDMDMGRAGFCDWQCLREFMGCPTTTVTLTTEVRCCNNLF